VNETLALAKRSAAEGTTFAVLAALSFCHLMNDMLQSLVPAIYPMLKANYDLSFTQVGLITLTTQLTASLLQPLVGLYTDRRPMPYSLAMGMGFTFLGMLLLGVAGSYPILLAAAALIGMGSSVFHPESSRIARLASGGRHGMAQSLFQVGGNAGRRSGHCSRPSSCCRAGRAASAGFLLRRSWP
jgi:FSR family fosmidomycin resistance protein-like MFS transporter